MIDAIVLAGGMGTRLRPVTGDLPKPMAPVAGRPFLEILLSTLARKGLRRAVLSLGYRAERIRDHFGARFAGVELDFEIEPVPLGTGGAIRRALARCRTSTALVVNGDTLLDLELDTLLGFGRSPDCPVLVARAVDDTARYGRLDVERGRLIAFAEKSGSGPGLVNTGHYRLPCHLFEGQALPEAFSIEHDFLAPRAADLGIEVFVSHGTFIDIGVPEDYARAQSELAAFAL
jgi:D-glycero-alpha-D-manno-heptose 1-phosphate guanylyltransferase